MSQPVKLSDSLVLDARLAGEVTQRSIAGQVEFWARIGCAVELLLQGRHALALSRTAALRPLSSGLESVDSPEGHRRLETFLETLPYPHYRPHPETPGLLIRTDSDGRQTVGRFVNREFRPSERRPRKR